MLGPVVVGADVTVPVALKIPVGLDSASLVAAPPKRVVGAVAEAGAAPNMLGPGVDPALAVENTPPMLCGVDVFLFGGWGIDAVENIPAMGFAASPVEIAGLSPVGVAALCKAGPPKANPGVDDVGRPVEVLLNRFVPPNNPVALPLPDMVPLGVDAEVLPPPKGKPDGLAPNKPPVVPVADDEADVPAVGAPKAPPKLVVEKSPPVEAPDVVPDPFPPWPTGPDPNIPPP